MTVPWKFYGKIFYRVNQGELECILRTEVCFARKILTFHFTSPVVSEQTQKFLYFKLGIGETIMSTTALPRLKAFFSVRNTDGNFPHSS